MFEILEELANSPDTNSILRPDPMTTIGWVNAHILGIWYGTKPVVMYHQGRQVVLVNAHGDNRQSPLRALRNRIFKYTDLEIMHQRDGMYWYMPHEKAPAAFPPRALGYGIPVYYTTNSEFNHIKLHWAWDGETNKLPQMHTTGMMARQLMAVADAYGYVHRLADKPSVFEIKTIRDLMYYTNQLGVNVNDNPNPAADPVWAYYKRDPRVWRTGNTAWSFIETLHTHWVKTWFVKTVRIDLMFNTADYSYLNLSSKRDALEHVQILSWE